MRLRFRKSVLGDDLVNRTKPVGEKREGLGDQGKVMLLNQIALQLMQWLILPSLLDSRGSTSSPSFPLSTTPTSCSPPSAPSFPPSNPLSAVCHTATIMLVFLATSAFFVSWVTVKTKSGKNITR
ncbi:hypothetical protein ACB098_06G034300 [Castanea mollissima]